jgi:hypothetical protein
MKKSRTHNTTQIWDECSPLRVLYIRAGISNNTGSDRISISSWFQTRITIGFLIRILIRGQLCFKTIISIIKNSNTSNT